MKPLYTILPALKKLVRSGTLVILLDFDGTLSAIAPTPQRAVLSEKNQQVLRRLKRHVNIAIISGRTLSDIKKKVGIPGLLYSGNHGLEWEIAGKKFIRPIPHETKLLFTRIQKTAKSIFHEFPGAFMENKSLTMAIHYRELKQQQIPLFCRKLRKILKPLARRDVIRVDHHKKTFDIRPQTAWTKGEVALEILKHFGLRQKKLFPLYIGDSVTDEDAFRALAPGITVRVGRKKGSVAGYFVEKRNDVDRLLAKLLYAVEENMTG